MSSGTNESIYFETNCHNAVVHYWMGAFEEFIRPISRINLVFDDPTRKRANTKIAKATDNDAKKLSALDAVAKVLGESKEPISCKELIETMAANNNWTSPGGKTPAQTLYSAIQREITTKGEDARFKKTDRGQFAAK